MAVYELPALDYNYSALEPAISAEINELHHTKHHQSYLAGANTTLEKLASARENGDYGDVVGLEITLGFNLAGHSNHVLWWKVLSPHGGDNPAGELAAAIDESFGSWDAFQAHYNAAATTVQGNGWAAL